MTARKQGSDSNTYHVWENMLQRCYNSKHPSFKHYGGRGIFVCKCWLKFACFYKDMGKQPAGLSLDRINNNKNYTKNNCRWTTQKQQVWNSKKSKLVKFKGVLISRRELAKKLKLPKSTVSDRLKRGWSLEKLLNFNKQ